MTTQAELEIAPSYRPLTVRIRDGWQNALKRRRTREYGRHHPRTSICPKCFAAFTKKGIARHIYACKR